VGVNATTHILFDHNNDGIITGTGWVKGEDAFYFSRHPELVSGSKREMPNRVRHDGNTGNNLELKNERKVA